MTYCLWRIGYRRLLGAGQMTMLLMQSTGQAHAAMAAAVSQLRARSSPDWLRDGVIYEIFPRDFSAAGTLGCPYAVRAYRAINGDYGTDADLHALIGEAHKRGLRVLIDIVANHMSWDSVMMTEPDFYRHDARGPPRSLCLPRC